VGRTNESSWSADKTYGPRSAAIFKQIALDLRFNSTLVDKYTFYLVDNVFKDSTEDLKQRLVTILKHKGAYFTDSEFASRFSDYEGGRDKFDIKFHIFLIYLFTS
jgi:hypothetical protein